MSITIKEIGKGGLSPGQSETVTWLNPPMKKVVGFWVTPKELAADEFLPGGGVSFQITKVLSSMPSPNQFRVDVTVKNTSVNGQWIYVLYASYLT